VVGVRIKLIWEACKGETSYIFQGKQIQLADLKLDGISEPNHMITKKNGPGKTGNLPNIWHHQSIKI
jgi:hypothetical protein